MHTSLDASIPQDVVRMPALDEDGFLVDPQQWTPQLADQLAVAAALPPLGERHFRTIDFIREKYLSIGAMPPMRQTCRKIGLGRHEIKSLFGGCRQLWRIAGLPNPGGEAMSYMD